MLNFVWGFMILIGITVAACNGNMLQVSNAALESSKEAVALCITMLGVMSFWVGMMRIAQEAGIIKSMTKWMRPILRYLFPELSAESKAYGYIATNMIANILGLGWAATPAGLKAMQELGKVNRQQGKGIASKEMCTFLIINISSLQLIPVNIIAYRSQYGSLNPTEVIVPGLIATIISTMTAVVFCKVMQGVTVHKDNKK